MSNHDRQAIVAVALGSSIFFIISLVYLTSWPAFWFDESIAFQIARNAALHGVFDVGVAPGQFAPYALMIGANGYPLTLPLSLVFDLFGITLSIARATMLIWCIGFIGLVFWFMRKYFGTYGAVGSSLLILSFSSFFAEGRTVTGEMPGFFFLLLGLTALLSSAPFLAGLLLGLAAAAKPSLYLLLFIPAVADAFISRQPKKGKHLLFGALGYAISTSLFFFLTTPLPVPHGFFAELLAYYRNPFGSTSLVSNILNNIAHPASISTYAYFGILGILVLFALGYLSWKDLAQRRIWWFLGITSVISLIYFLRSPGWLRYLFPLEISVLLLISPALIALGKRFVLSPKYAFFAVSILILLQAYVWFFHADISRSNAPLQVATYISAELRPLDRVGVINAPTITALVSSDRTYQYISIMTGIPPFGVNPLSLPFAELPKLIVVGKDSDLGTTSYESVLETEYGDITPPLLGYQLYERRP